jgi:hypothetical protein
MTADSYRTFGSLGAYFRGQRLPDNSDDDLIDWFRRDIRSGDLVLVPSPIAPFDLAIIGDRLKVVPGEGSPIDADDFQMSYRVVETLGPYTKAIKPGDTLLDLYHSILRDRPPADARKHLWDLKRAYHFRTVEDLPDCRPTEGENGELVLEALDGLGNIDPASVTIRKSDRLDPPPISLEQLALLDVATPKKLVRIAPPPRATNVETSPVSEIAERRASKANTDQTNAATQAKAKDDATRYETKLALFKERRQEANAP